MLAAYTALRQPRTAAAPLALGILAAALGLRTWARNADWRDNVTLDTAAVSACPKSYKTHAMLASALFTADPDHGNIDRVIEQAELSLAALDPLPDLHNVAQAYGQAANYYLLRGDILLQHDPSGDLKPGPESIRAYQRSLQILLRCVSIFQAFDRRDEEQARVRGKPVDTVASRSYVNAYRMLSTAYLRLLDMNKALDAALHARSLDPANPDTYHQISDILRIEGRPDDAAVMLMTGAALTSDAGLAQDLMQLYRSGLDSRGCAIIDGPGGPAINPACPMVHQHLCAAAADTIRLHLAGRSRDLAVKTRNQAVAEFGCPTEPLDHLLADGPG